MIEQFFTSKTVLVTGAAGFIGSHLCDKLLELGAQVIGLDNFVTGNENNLTQAKENERFQLAKVDLNDQEALLAQLGQLKLTDKGRNLIILHFASPASPPLYQKYPTETYLVNTLALHNLLAWMKDYAPAGRLLFAGTSEAYGNPLEHPQKETYWGNVNPNGPRSCYDEAKRLGETICGVFYRQFGLDTRIIRIFNTYGPRMDLNDGRVLPQFIKEYLAGENLTIYGDGSQTRSYCFVSDLVDGVLKFVASADLAGETINLGNPGEYTILETAQLFNETVDREPQLLEYLPLPTDDPVRRQPNIDKARRLLDWAPQVDFKTGLEMMINSYQNKV